MSIIPLFYKDTFFVSPIWFAYFKVCEGRNDNLSDIVRLRLEGAPLDLHAADAS